MRNAVFSVIFPANLVFFDDFIASLNYQDVSNYELFLVNDGVNSEVLAQKLLTLKAPVKVADADGKLTPTEIRMYGIKKLLEQNRYKKVIFADTDDYMSFDRVRLSLIKLDEYPIVFNDLTLVNEVGVVFNEHIWNSRIEHLKLDKTFLLNKNVLGLGNSAILASHLRLMDIPQEIIAVDWYYFSNLLNDEDEIGYVGETVTYYRQHSANTVGVKRVSLERLKFITEVKEAHFRAMSKIDNQYLEQLKEIQNLKEQLNNKNFDINNLLNTHTNYFWWEESNFLNNETDTIN